MKITLKPHVTCLKNFRRCFSYHHQIFEHMVLDIKCCIYFHKFPTNRYIVSESISFIFFCHICLLNDRLLKNKLSYVLYIYSLFQFYLFVCLIKLINCNINVILLQQKRPWNIKYQLKKILLYDLTLS